MSKPNILIQFDPDSHASTFDSIVAIDSGIDHLITQPGVTVKELQSLVHGAMFTRGPADLKHTALFFGGSNVAETEQLVAAARKCFFGPMRVSLMSDPNGSNTTAAAAVICAQKHIDIAGKTITILAGTGPVGQRIAQIVAGVANRDPNAPPTVKVCSRKLAKAEAVCGQLNQKMAGNFVPVQTANGAEALSAIANSQIVFAAGAAGVELLPSTWQQQAKIPDVMVDLNAVPPAGIAGVEVTDSAQPRNGAHCFGAIGVGGLKMKIHKKAIRMLFETNDRDLDVDEIYAIGDA
jgi:hypothetical protein